MDAVQNGFSSVCLYSGSYLRGTLEKTNDYWMAAAVGYADQILYINSPYNRKDNKSLFATAVYPFRYDSLGFPGMMVSVPSGSTAHRPINGMKNTTIWLILPVTVLPKATVAPATAKDGGIDEENIEYLSFGENGTSFTLDSARERLERYAKLPIEDDVPHDGELTWANKLPTPSEWHMGAWQATPVLCTAIMTLRNPYIPTYSERSGTHFAEKELGDGDRMYQGGD